MHDMTIKEQTKLFGKLIEFLAAAAPLHTLDSYADTFPMEIDNYINHTDRLKILDIVDGSSLGVTCLVKAEVLPANKALNNVQLSLELLFGYLAPGGLKISQTIFFEECIVHLFLKHTLHEGDRPILVILVGTGEHYSKLQKEWVARR